MIKPLETMCLNSKGGRKGIEGLQPSIQDRIYSSFGLSPAMVTGFFFNVLEVKPMKEKTIKVGQMSGYEIENRVYSAQGVCPSIAIGGGPKKIIEGMKLDLTTSTHTVAENKIVAMRGREDGQQLEPRSDECTNTITTVQKDNLVLSKQATKDGKIPTLTAENNPRRLEPWQWKINGEIYTIRIRRLTPLESWRLMGFSDEDFHKAEQVNSNTQLYKQAGNSIVKDVLVEIFRNLFEENRTDVHNMDGESKN